MPARKRKRLALAPSAVSRALANLLRKLPVSKEETSAHPAARSRRLRTSAAREAAAISAGLALPPGLVGLLTVLPELFAIWKVQSNLVADIASAHGKTASLTKETMIYCLFKHGGAALTRDIVVRTGERFLVKRASLGLMQNLLSKIGVRISRRVVARAVSRWAPVVGALGVGAYAYYDTKKVGDNAIELFSADVQIARTAPSGEAVDR